jgi:hypothetical protein
MMDLSKLKDPFPPQDIEWRVSRAGKGRDGKTFCRVLAYVTARAIQNRLDEVCGPENWKLEEPRILDIAGKPAFACGLSIRINDEWVTKWDVAEPTNVEPAKGGWSGAEKRAGVQWGVARHLHYLDEAFAEVSESPQKGWNYAKLPEKHGGGEYYWQPPRLPEWALPKDSEVSKEQLKELVSAWREKFAADIESPAERREGFTRLVHSVVGEFPVADHTCWTREAVNKCRARIQSTTDPNGPDSDVPFSGADQRVSAEARSQ